MKKAVIGVVALVIMAFAFNVMAFDVKGAIKKEATNAAATSLQSQMNQDLAKYNCTWNKTAVKVDGCDINRIGAYLSSKQKAMEKARKEMGQNLDCDIHVHTKDPTAYNFVRERLLKLGAPWYDITKDTHGVTGSSLKFTTIVRAQ